MNLLTWKEKTPDDGEITFDAYLGKRKVGTIYTLNDQRGWYGYSRLVMDTTGGNETIVLTMEEVREWMEKIIDRFLEDVSSDLKGQIALLIIENDNLCQQLAEK